MKSTEMSMLIHVILHLTSFLFVLNATITEFLSFTITAVKSSEVRNTKKMLDTIQTMLFSVQ